MSTPTRAVVVLESGSAHFEVAHNPARVFRVEIGDVAVEVLGTRFVIDRLGDRARVGVLEGRVHVTWPNGEAELGPGETELFPREVTPPKRAARSASSGRPAAAAGWRDLARDGDFDDAYRALERQGPTAVKDLPAELLLAADVARLSGHPTEAIPSLARVLQAHAADPRAPLAAFTLGRVYLDELGRPRDAAAAFASVRRLDPRGLLAEDALAREVEAWSRASYERRAHEAALEYLKLYPDGHRLKSVRRFGGVE